jgi:transketolase
MAQYSKPNLTIVGSHAGCSIGPDGASQMALEDIAMMRSIRESVVLYPSDAVSTYAVTQTVASQTGLHYIRTTREKTPLIYPNDEQFPIGGLKIHQCHSDAGQNADIVIIGAGITLHEALKAQKTLEEKQIHTTVVDLYSIKPLYGKMVTQLAQKAKKLIVVEDHYAAGGIGEAVLSELSVVKSQLLAQFIHLCVRKEPRSGTPEELMRYEEIDATAIVQAATI